MLETLLLFLDALFFWASPTGREVRWVGKLHARVAQRHSRRARHACETQDAYEAARRAKRRAQWDAWIANPHSVRTCASILRRALVHQQNHQRTAPLADKPRQPVFSVIYKKGQGFEAVERILNLIRTMGNLGPHARRRYPSCFGVDPDPIDDEDEWFDRLVVEARAIGVTVGINALPGEIRNSWDGFYCEIVPRRQIIAMLSTEANEHAMRNRPTPIKRGGFGHTPVARLGVPVHRHG